MELPEEVSGFFWDVDPAGMDPDKHATFIIERLLEHGDLRAIRWVLANYDEALIVGTIKNSRRISRKTASFWAGYYGIPRGDILCLKESSRKAQESFWPH